MELLNIERLEIPQESKKLERLYSSFDSLINDLRNREIPDEIINSINEKTSSINSSAKEKKILISIIRKSIFTILNLLEKELNLVPRNHYQKKWLAIGMAVFGIPLGVAFGAGLSNMAFIGIGIPLGMAIGIGVGTAMDSRAKEKGKQLDIEM